MKARSIKKIILQPTNNTVKGIKWLGSELWITHYIAKSPGRRLKIDSVPGENTTFLIHLGETGLHGF